MTTLPFLTKKVRLLRNGNSTYLNTVLENVQNATEQRNANIATVKDIFTLRGELNFSKNARHVEVLECVRNVMYPAAKEDSAHPQVLAMALNNNIYEFQR